MPSGSVMSLLGEAPRFLAAVAVGGAVALLVELLRPQGLSVETDIVGYPTFANFDIYDYFWWYALAVVVFPLATLGAYAALTRVRTGRRATPRAVPAPLRSIEAIPEVTGWRTWSVTAGRTLFVGCAFGLEVAIWLGQGVTALLGTAGVYAGLVAVVGWVASRGGRSLVEAVGAANVLAAPLLVAGLYGVSRSTHVTVTSTGEEHAYPWLPAWLAFAVAAALLAFLVVRLGRSPHADVNVLERRVLLLLVAPVVLFLVLADLPGELGTVNLYEEGQVLAASDLTLDGAFPWRDLLVAHGLLFDVGQGIVGFELFEDSRWGLVAALQLLAVPLTGLAVYYVCAYLLWTNWLALLGAELLIVTGHVSELETRFLLLPIVLLLLAALLQRPSVLRAAAFTTTLAIQTIVTPEALVAVFAYTATLVGFEIYYYERGSGLARGFRRVLYCSGSAAVLAVIWLGFLAANRVVDDWIFSFAATIPGHQLTGGIPLLVPRDDFEIVATGVLLLSVFAFVSARMWTRRTLAYRDWVMVAMAGLSLLYFTKFLGRADRYHLNQAFSVTVPLLFYAGYRAITFLEAWVGGMARARRLGWVPRRHTVLLPVLVVLLAFAPAGLGAVTSAPRHFEEDVAAEPEIERIGYSRAGENDPQQVRSLAAALDRFLEPGEAVFDFSNAPGLFHYILERRPANRYYHVSLAIRRRTQSDLVRELEREPPGVVVLTSIHVPTSHPSWDDVANQIRHYDVSQYLLDRYVPVAEVGGFVLARPRRDGARSDPGLYFTTPECDWGYVPNFFSPSPDDETASKWLRFVRSADGKQLVVTLPPDAADYRWLEVTSGAPLGPGRFEITDELGSVDERKIGFNTLPGIGTKARVMVGSCAQWRGYRPGVVYLTTSEPQDIDRIRLVR